MNRMEDLIHHFKLYPRHPRPEGEATRRRAPKGEFGIYIVSDGANKPYASRPRAGFPHLRRSTRWRAAT